MARTVGFPVNKINASHAKMLKSARESLKAGIEHRQARREDIWRITKNQYEARQWSVDDRSDESADLTTVNVSFATIQTIKPYITGNEPRFYLEPFSSDATRTAAALQEVFLNRLWRHPPVGAQDAMKQAVFEFLTYGDGFVKATYTIDPVMVSLGEEDDKANIHVDKISIWDIWIDQYASTLAEARWVAHRIWSTKRQVLEEDRYTVPKDFVFADRQSESNDEGRRDRTNLDLADGDEWVELIEYYDIIDRRLITFPRSAGDTDLPWQVVDEVTIPIVQLPNYELPDSPWHMGDLEQIKDLQDELNKTRSELMTHRRRNVAKLVIRKGVMGTTAKDALRSPIVHEVVEIDSAEPLDSIFQAVQLPPISADNYAASQEIKDDIREITGITEYQRGIGSQVSRTATEASIMDASANVKLTSKLTVVENAARQLGVVILGIARDVFPETRFEEWALFIGGDEAKRLNRMALSDQAASLQESGDPAGAAQVINQDVSERADLQPSPAMFIGEYEVLVQIGSTEYRDPKLREERLRDMFFSLLEASPLLAQSNVQIDMQHMLRLWLESTDLTDVDSLVSGTSGAPSQQEQIATQAAADGAPGTPGPAPGTPQGLDAILQGLQGGGANPQVSQTPDNTGMLASGEVSSNSLA